MPEPTTGGRPCCRHCNAAFGHNPLCPTLPRNQDQDDDKKDGEK